MRIHLSALAAALTVACLSSGTAWAQTAAPQEPLRRPDVIFVPTPEDVVEAMLQLAGVTKNDIVYDLGCGDGRIPVMAAQKHGARGVCVDIDPQRIKEANERVAKSGVSDRVRVLNADLFTTDLSEATVITLYLLPALNVKLMPTLKSLRPGTRVVSNSFDMQGQWKPDKEIDIDGRRVYLWIVPKR